MQKLLNPHNTVVHSSCWQGADGEVVFHELPRTICATQIQLSITIFLHDQNEGLGNQNCNAALNFSQSVTLTIPHDRGAQKNISHLKNNPQATKKKKKEAALDTLFHNVQSAVSPSITPFTQQKPKPTTSGSEPELNKIYIIFWNALASTFQLFLLAKRNIKINVLTDRFNSRFRVFNFTSPAIGKA